MTTSPKMLALAALLLAGAARGQDHHAHTDPATAPDTSTKPLAKSPEAQRFAKEMDAGMAKMMDAMHASGYTGNPDVDFLTMMIPHHAGAVEMARLVLVHGKDPLTRRMAEEIIAAQTAEIETMQRRLAILRRSDDMSPEGFPSLDGTRGGEQP
ncbi:MAG TPA: DUF305 domain-containing protein [Anaeromyxobacteraceae bacterium]|nr:DUF305 domain-containing protein [Anaeromyxobacteraceae bacterium]